MQDFTQPKAPAVLAPTEHMEHATTVSSDTDGSAVEEVPVSSLDTAIMPPPGAAESQAPDTEEESPSYPEARGAVYTYLTLEVCPAQPAPVPKAKAFWESEAEAKPRRCQKWPQSPTVATLINDLRGTPVLMSKDWLSNSQSFVHQQGTKYYVPHKLGSSNTHRYTMMRSA